ncbi:AAA family ATPase, partial [Salmonella enterica]|nr:AAA family ATPase [Salmonella enterica]
MSQYLKFVIQKFDTASRTALDTAISHAISLHHKEVMPEHLLLALINQQYILMDSLSLQVGFSLNNIIEATHKSLKNIPPCQIQSPVFTSGLVQWILNSWMFASATLGKSLLSPAMLIAGLFEDSVIQALASNIQQNINFDHVQIRNLLCEDERNMQSVDKNIVVKNKELEKYTHNLSELARRGKLDPVIGREAEIRQMIDILLRRKQNNPILTGEPGVGKTALAEGLALRIAAGTVPEMLKLAEVLTLDLSLLQAGANVKGEFELRLQSILKEVNKSPYPIILFIDEAHTLIGAGGLAGQNDAANLLKPALARGELRVIAATTWAEYKKYFEKDAALVRRFQVVKVAEPDAETAETMLRAVVPTIVRHHGIPVLESAIHAAVALSSRYMADRHLPDKAISLLDTACARVAVSQVHEPKEVERIKVQLLAIREECKALTYEHTAPERIKELKQQAEQLQYQLNSLHQLWKKQLELVNQLLNTQNHDEIIRGRETLGTYHQEHAMVFECVDATCVADVLSEWTGIPLGRMLEKEYQQLNLLSDRLSQRIIGQSYALDTITQQIRINRAGLSDPLKPTGVYLLAGPSGTGKTETSLALAELLFGGEQNLVTINMSEYQEAHSVSGLKGSPPGYVGYGQGGILTEAVRRNPYCVVLLDEVEKAHPDVMELFYQVFDKGYIE